MTLHEKIEALEAFRGIKWYDAEHFVLGVDDTHIVGGPKDSFISVDEAIDHAVTLCGQDASISKLDLEARGRGGDTLWVLTMFADRED